MLGYISFDDVKVFIVQRVDDPRHTKMKNTLEAVLRSIHRLH